MVALRIGGFLDHYDVEPNLLIKVIIYLAS